MRKGEFSALFVGPAPPRRFRNHAKRRVLLLVSSLQHKTTRRDLPSLSTYFAPNIIL
jgi:hypothetical protein